MYKLLPIAIIASGIAVFELTASGWVRLGLEFILGVLAVILGSIDPKQTPNLTSSHKRIIYFTKSKANARSQNS